MHLVSAKHFRNILTSGQRNFFLPVRTAQSKFRETMNSHLSELLDYNAQSVDRQTHA
jgi:hypothetical protein